MSDPREQHYHFAHRILPHLALSNPAKFMVALEDPEWIQVIWSRVGEDYKKPMSGKGLSSEFREAEETQVGIVTMPMARKISEAILAVVLVRGPRARYFVLELNEENDGTPCMNHCEWSTHGEYRDFGKFAGGREVDKDAFVEACLKLWPVKKKSK